MSKIFRLSILVFLGISLTGIDSDAFAKKKRKKRKKKKKMSYVLPYGMAGCGLGSIIIKSNGKFMQLSAMTTNNYSGQTFAITSGTSNCVNPSNTSSLKIEQETYVAVNLRELAKDTSRGQGEFLFGFSQVLGCENESYGRLAALGKDNYSSIFSKENAKAVLGKYIDLIKSDESLAKNCTRAVVHS